MYECDSCGDMALHLAPGDSGIDDALILCGFCLEDYRENPAALERLRADVITYNRL